MIPPICTRYLSTYMHFSTSHRTSLGAMVTVSVPKNSFADILGRFHDFIDLDLGGPMKLVWPGDEVL